MLAGSPVAIDGNLNVKPVAKSADGSVGISREKDAAATLPATNEASQRGTDRGGGPPSSFAPSSSSSRCVVAVPSVTIHGCAVS